MNKRTREILEEIESSGESAAVAVVDHIRTVASNGREYSTPEAILSEAESLSSWASTLATRLKKGKTKSSEEPQPNEPENSAPLPSESSQTKSKRR